MKLILVALLVLPKVLGSQTTLGGNSNIGKHTEHSKNLKYLLNKNWGENLTLLI